MGQKDGSKGHKESTRCYIGHKKGVTTKKKINKLGYSLMKSHQNARKAVKALAGEWETVLPPCTCKRLLSRTEEELQSWLRKRETTQQRNGREPYRASHNRVDPNGP